MKLVPVPVISTMAGLLIASMFLYPQEMLRNGMGMLLMLLAALVFFAWHGVRMKSVSVDLENLYVSGYTTSAVIPLAELKFVHYSPGIGLVIAQLKSPSVFGDKIAFMPTWANALLATWGQPSIVEELRHMAHGSVGAI